MIQIIVIMAVLLSFIFPIDSYSGTKTNTQKSVNYTQMIQDWADTTFANRPVVFRVGNVSVYHDKRDPQTQRLSFLILLNYNEEVTMAFLLIINPDTGVERHTLLGSDFFNQIEPDDTMYYQEMEEADT